MAYAQPKLEIVGGDTHDWGKVKPGKLTTVVQVKNAGTTELKISKVQPACGCTAAPIDKDLLKPGEIGKISITLDVTSRSGPVDKTVSIESNDSSAPMRTLHLKADVRRDITVTPMQYMMVTDGKVGVETPASVVKIKNTGDAPFKIDVPQLVDGATFGVRFDLKESRELKPGEEFELKAYVTPKDSKSITGTIKMKTSNSEMPSIDIPITGTMAPPATSSAPATAPSPVKQ
jgi:hypothetical protein